MALQYIHMQIASLYTIETNKHKDQPVEQRYGVRNLFHVVAKRITFQGYITDGLSFTPEQFGEANEQLSKWLASGALIDQYTVIDGFDQLPNALLGLFQSKNTGKMMVRCGLPSEIKANIKTYHTACKL